MASTAGVEESKEETAIPINHNAPNNTPKIIINDELSRKAGDNIFLKLIQGNKMGRFFLFMFLYFFVFKVIDYILLFFNVNREFIYTYFTWFSILFLFFVLLPLAKSKI